MQKPRKIVIVSQYYPPDGSTTAAIMSALAAHLALEWPVLVLSGTLGSASTEKDPGRLDIVEIRNWMPAKAALFRRAVADAAFTVRVFWAILKNVRNGDIVLTVTAPFMSPYAVALAAKLKKAGSILIMHDLYPDVLVVAGLTKPDSLLASAIRYANAMMFRAVNAIVIIGRDTERLLVRYGATTRDKTCFIPNWATLAPGVRPIMSDNPYRQLCKPHLVVGLSGNLGFTHDPLVVFEAARLLRDDLDIHFLLSGWGIGFEQLKEMQSQDNLRNVTLVDRVEDKDLEEFLSAANIWLIPYRKDAAGVSVPSRFYNLLAVGRPVILVSEPDAEAALTVTEHRVGWIVAPGNAADLAGTIRLAALSEDTSRAERASAIAGSFGSAEVMKSYSVLIQELFRKYPMKPGSHT